MTLGIQQHGHLGSVEYALKEEITTIPSLPCWLYGESIPTEQSLDIKQPIRRDNEALGVGRAVVGKQWQRMCWISSFFLASWIETLNTFKTAMCNPSAGVSGERERERERFDAREVRCERDAAVCEVQYGIKRCLATALSTNASTKLYLKDMRPHR